jgi:alpha-amylase
VRYKAVVLDNAGHVRGSRPRAAAVPAPALTLEAPAAGANVRGTVEVRAVADPERATHVVAFERSVDGGPWTPIGSDDSSPVYTVFDEIAGLGLATGTPIRYRAILSEPDGTRVVSEERTVRQAPPPLQTAVVHYRRPAGDYADWGLHLWGDGIVAGTDWNAPLQRVSVDAFGARYEIALKDDTKPVNFIVHRPGGDNVPTTREPGGDRSFVPVDAPEIWLIQGDAAVYTSQPATG